MAYTIPAQTFNGLTIPEPLAYGKNVIWKTGSLYHKTDEDVYVLIAQSRTNGYKILLATEYSGKRDYYSNDGEEWFNNNPFSVSVTYNGKSVYLKTYDLVNQTVTILQPGDLTIGNIRGVTNTGGGSVDGKLSWLMIYGGYIGYLVTYDVVNCTGDENNPGLIQPFTPITIANFIPDESEDEIFTFNSGSCWIDGQGAEPETPVLFVFDPETGNLRIGLVTSDITIHVYAYGDPYQDTDGESDIPGGGSVSVPGLPAVSATSSGVIGLFAPSAAQMRQLADYMWADFGGSAATTDDILKEIVQAIKRSICNPLDYIIGLNLIPSDGLMIGSSDTVRFGFTSSGVSMPRLNSQFFIVNCGTLSFDALCGDTFLDYAPYSKFSIYLPYIGFQDVDANDFVGHTIGVIYHGDVVTGAVTAYITKDGSVMYQYSGCCALSIPLNADGWGSTISGAVQIASSLITGAVSGGAAGVASSAISGAANVAANPSLLSPQVRHSGAVSGGAGAMGVQKPFVIREAVRFHSTAGFNCVSGYPSYYYKQLSNVHGFTVVENVHLHGVKATNEEIEDIENLLKTGVIL